MIDWTEISEWVFGADHLIEGKDYVTLLCRLVIDLIIVGVLVGLVYSRRYKNREHVFTMVILNVITFSMCVLLRKVPVDIGFALGLFAVFGILRYRTEPIRVRDLSYLFIVIGIGIINGTANKKVSALELLTVDVVIVGLAAAIELYPKGRSRTVPLLYDNLQLLRADKRPELIADVERRTGLGVTRVDLIRIDLLRDAAEVIIHYDDAE